MPWLWRGWLHWGNEALLVLTAQTEADKEEPASQLGRCPHSAGSEEGPQAEPRRWALGCRRGWWQQGLSGHSICLGNQRSVLSVEPHYSQRRDVIKCAFHSACCKKWGHWLQERGQWGLSQQHRNMLRPVYTGFVFWCWSDINYISSLQSFWKKYGCRKMRVITYNDSCQTRLVIRGAFSLSLCLNVWMYVWIAVSILYSICVMSFVHENVTLSLGTENLTIYPFV